MDYRYLHAFVWASKHLNFTLAAKELNITPAALSRQIKLFEESVGRQLFIRSPQHVSLTSDGKELYQIVQSFTELTNGYLGHDSKKEIRIGSIQPIVEGWFPDFIYHHYKNSNISLKILSTAPSKITEMLEKGELDLGLYNKNIQSELLTSIKFLKEQPVLISKKKIELNDISNLPWIIVEEKDYIVNLAFKKRIKRSESIIMVNSPTSQIKFIERGLGVGIVSSLLVSKNSKLFQTPITEFSNEFFYLVMPNSHLIQKHLLSFKENVISFSN